jgi:hypothetical protein
MPRTLDNPDRDFSSAPINEPECEDLRELLKKSEVADIFDPIVRQRIGELIGGAGLRSRYAAVVIP